MQRGGLGAAPAAAAGEEEEEDYMSEKFLKQQEAEQRRVDHREEASCAAGEAAAEERSGTLSALTCMRCVRFAECRGRLLMTCRRRRYWRRVSPSTSTNQIRGFNC